MEGLKDFLESSTIHGLWYISTSKSKTAKAVWILVVAFGFGSAGYLIQSSFADWTDSPVATTITTHSVDELPFPNVAVCPPKGINSALKYDLMRTANTTLTGEMKKRLLEKYSLEDDCQTFKSEIVKIDFKPVYEDHNYTS